MTEQHCPKCESYKALVQDMCEIDHEVRELCRPYTDVDGDGFCVPSLGDVVEGAIRALKEADDEKD